MGQDKILNELAEVLDSKFLKTLSEPVRIDILKFLILKGQSDIGTIAENMPQDRSVVSRHLNLMHEVGILKGGKDGRHMLYEVDGEGFLNKLESISALVRACIKLSSTTQE